MIYLNFLTQYRLKTDIFLLHVSIALAKTKHFRHYCVPFSQVQYRRRDTLRCDICT